MTPRSGRGGYSPLPWALRVLARWHAGEATAVDDSEFGALLDLYAAEYFGGQTRRPQ